MNRLLIRLLALILLGMSGMAQAADMARLLDLKIGTLHYRAAADLRLKQHEKVWKRLDEQARADFTSELQKSLSSKRRKRTVTLDYEVKFRGPSLISVFRTKHSPEYEAQASVGLDIENRTLPDDRQIVLLDLFREFDPGGETVTKLTGILKEGLARQRKEQRFKAPKDPADDVYLQAIYGLSEKPLQFVFMPSPKLGIARGVTIFITPEDETLANQGTFFVEVPTAILVPFLKPDMVGAFGPGCPSSCGQN